MTADSTTTGTTRAGVAQLAEQRTDQKTMQSSINGISLILKRILLVVSVAVMAACGLPEAQKQVSTSNPTITVEIIAKTKDGCVIYRFTGEHYFVRCEGSPDIASVARLSCGKNCVREEEVVTIGGNR